MDITGYSRDFIVDAGFGPAMTKFTRLQSERWPDLYMNGEAFAAGADAWKLPEVDDDGSGMVTFSSGPAMEEFWEENGYDLDPSGVGPFSVFYLKKDLTLHAQNVSGVRIPSPDLRGAIEGIELLLTSYYAVSVVTPGDSALDSFSGSVVQDFIATFSA